MFGVENFTVFLISGIVLNITPGADTCYILGRSISQGTKAGVVSVLGIINGALLHTLLVACSIVLLESCLSVLE